MTRIAGDEDFTARLILLRGNSEQPVWSKSGSRAVSPVEVCEMVWAGFGMVPGLEAVAHLAPFD
ncbi:hypothetical protein SH668x_000590 [Planctomicrobium sp. SH668]|uniref:hypothetical protein n=1 Tax=Planctomicrobium sp. SH668 TaxID=3448126 RepID=UPI003F5B4ED3